jgi:hypothetical protein
MKPDWSIISDECFDERGGYANLVPGDTKLNAKWWPTMFIEDVERFDEW